MTFDPDRVLLAIMALLGVNHLLFRFPGWEDRRAIFWGLQAVNAAAAVAVAAILPAFHRDARMLNWLVGLLLVYHVLINHFRLRRTLQAREHQAVMAEVRRQQRASDADDALPPADPPLPPA